MSDQNNAEKKNANMPKESKEERAKREAQKKEQEKKVEPSKKVGVNREIVRIAGVDLNGNLRIDRALTSIKGIGIRSSKVFAYNCCKRQNDSYTGKSKHLIGSDLLFSVREDKQRLSKIKSRRGLRLQAGLPVRGQKTRSNFRRREGVVGVMKNKQTPGKAAPQQKSEKKESKK